MNFIDDKNNPEVLETLIKRSRHFYFNAKMGMCRAISHLIDNIFPVEKGNIQRKTNLYQLYENCYMFELEFISLMFLVNPEVKGLTLKDLTTNDFRKLVNLLKSYSPPFAHINDYELGKMEGDYCEKWDTIESIFFTRMALLQFKHQVHGLRNLYRYHWMFTLDSENMNMKKIISDRFDADFNDYVKLTTTLFSYSAHCNVSLSYNHILSTFKEILFGEEKVKNMLNHLSATREDICRNYELLKAADKRLMVYDFNPLRKMPIIYKDGDEELFLPIPQFLFSAITKGFYHTLCHEDRAFRDKFGKEVFEKYVQHVLAWKKSDFLVIPEFEYHVGRDRCDSPDIMLVRGNDIIMIEVKATAPTVQLGVADSEHYIKQLTKAYGLGIGQCVKKEEHLRNGYLTHNDLPTTIDTVYYVVITLEEFYMFHTKFFDEQIKETVIREKNVVLPDDKFYHLMGVESLEYIIENDTRSFFDYVIDRETSGRAFSYLTSSDVNNKLAFGQLRSSKYFKDVMDEVTKNSKIKYK